MNLKSKKDKITIPGIDEKDIAILRILQNDAQTTVKDIAKAIQLSTTPVHERIKRLEHLGIIKQYAALLDYKKLGKELIVICYVSLKEHNKIAGTHFIQSINKMEEVLECYSISGEFDFLLKVYTANMDSYYDFHVNKLSQIENIGKVQSTFVMGVVKDTHKFL